MKHFRRLLAATALAGLALAMPPGSVRAETPADILVIANQIDDIITLDPAEAFEFAGQDVTHNVYNNLVNFDPADLDAGYYPDLAESWTVAEDGTSIAFKMRPGVKFHSGNPVRAEDAAFSLQRAVILNKTPAFILNQFGLTAENVTETITADGDTLTLKLDKPYASSFVLNCLGAAIGGIVDKELVLQHEENGDMGSAWLKTNSAGSGPYKVVGWRANEAVTLEANPDFYLGAPKIQRVIVRHVAESASQRLLLERGDIDAARNLNPEDIAGVRDAEGIEVVDELRGRIMYLGLNQTIPELANPKIIEAMKYLVDYEGIVNSFLRGQYTVHQTFLPETYLGAITDNPYKLDIEKAKALVAESGVENPTFEVGVRDGQDRIEVAQSLQNTFAQAGITLNISVGTGAQVLDKFRARQWPITLEAWGPDYPDPQTNASTFAFNPDNRIEAKATGYLSWRIGYDPGPLSADVDAAVVEQDRDKRIAMYEKMQRDFLATAPFVMMFQQIEQVAKQDNVKGLSLGGPITSAAYWKVTK